MSQNTSQALIDKLRQVLPNVKAGSLRIWGEWFGRPYDNIHAIIDCEAKNNCARISFDSGEILRVWDPVHFRIDTDTFRIRSASRVRWEWFYYGRPQIDENLYFEDFTRQGDKVYVSTNIDWYQPNFKPDTRYAAVELL